MTVVDDTGSGTPTPVDGALRARRREQYPSGIREIRLGRYRIGEVLGEGGMSTVYAAHDLLLERDVALKELRLDACVEPDVLVREARALAAVHHPHVVTLFGLHFESGRKPFFVMERVFGTNLELLLRNKQPSLTEALDLLAQAAAGIDAIHAAGLAHGDIKPGNVLVDEEGRVKIADFGLVPLLERMSQGEVLGTPAYMAPERAMGAVPEPAIAHKSDIYSFGVLAMELLTGRQPFVAENTAALLHAHVHQTAPRVSRMSRLARSFDEPIARALAKSPAQRPDTCRGIVAALRQAAMGTTKGGVALRLLVVDDDADQRSLMAEILAHQLRGAVIESASDGEGALDAVTRRPNVVVMDLAMPGLSGIPLIERVREIAPQTEIIVVTGHGSGAEWREARALGVRRFFVKPVDAKELTRAVRELADLERVA